MSDIKYLVDTYYLNLENFSHQTSSHWKKYGVLSKISFKRPVNSSRSSDHKYQNFEYVKILKLQGGGFGDFKKLSVFNFIVNLPILIYLFLKYWRTLKLNTFLTTFKYSIRTRQIFSYDLTRMSLTLDSLTKKLEFLPTSTITIIGDGYGRLGCLLKAKFPDCKIIQINLGRTLLFDYYYSLKFLPTLNHKLIRQNNDFSEFDFAYIEAELYQNFKFSSDLFINIASMQEMNVNQIAGYFDLIKSQVKSTHFYCCNRISKILPDGSEINFYEYPWRDLEILDDELCPWYQTFPTLKPPFVKKFDGPIQHRLAKLI
jgi:hypothetical protein